MIAKRTVLLTITIVGIAVVAGSIAFYYQKEALEISIENAPSTTPGIIASRPASESTSPSAFEPPRCSPDGNFTSAKVAKNDPGKVCFLRMSFEPLSFISSFADELVNLEFIDASNSNQTFIPPEIGRLQKLKVLNLGNNEIQRVPAELGQAASLEILILRNNPLPPEEITNLRKLLPRTEIIF